MSRLPPEFSRLIKPVNAETQGRIRRRFMEEALRNPPSRSALPVIPNNNATIVNNNESNQNNNKLSISSYRSNTPTIQNNEESINNRLRNFEGGKGRKTKRRKIKKTRRLRKLHNRSSA